jgi:drug/metabolite transporter (DMT)-like permease
MKNYKGIIFAVLSMVFLALRSLIDKKGSMEVQSPLYYSLGTLIFSTIFISIFVFIKQKNEITVSLKSLSFRSTALLILTGIIASGIVFILRFEGIQESTASFAALSQVISTGTTVLLAFLIFKDNLPRIGYILLPIIFFFTYIISVGDFRIESIRKGDFLILISAVFIGVTNIIAQHLSARTKSSIISFSRFFFGIPIILGVIFYSEPQGVEFSKIIWMFFSALVLTLNVISFYEAIKYSGASFASSLLVVGPALAMFLSFIFLGERFNNLQYLSALLVMVSGVILIQSKAKD